MFGFTTEITFITLYINSGHSSGLVRWIDESPYGLGLWEVCCGVLVLDSDVGFLGWTDRLIFQ